MERSGGRKARHKLRQSPNKAQNPAAAGMSGGFYRPLNADEVTKIIASAIELLGQLGVGEVPARLAGDFAAHGAILKDNGRVCFSKALIEDAIANAAKSFTLHGRDPDRSIIVGGDAVHFGTGGAAVETLDLDSGDYRASTLRDLYDFTRLQDVLPNVSWFTRCCVATDMANEFDLDINTVYALMAGTTKPVATSFTLAENVAPIVKMLDMVASGGSGGKDTFSQRPFLKAHISPVISPMRFGADAVDVVYECIRHNIPLSCITAAQSGATAPATLAGFMVQSLAETLASLVMVHCIKPGHPMVFSNWPFVIDLRTGGFSGGGPETTVMNAASAQIINTLGLPSGVASSMTDAKAIDAQYGIEKAMTATAAALAGGNLIYESSGMMASLMGVSFEAFVIDNEMHSAIYRTLRGIEVSDDTINLEAISASVLGDGHFLGSAETLAAMERDYYYPELSDRSQIQVWADAGKPDHWSRANKRAKEILSSHFPPYLEPSIDEKIRAAFDIKLDLPKPLQKTSK